VLLKCALKLADKVYRVRACGRARGSRAAGSICSAAEGCLGSNGATGSGQGLALFNGMVYTYRKAAHRQTEGVVSASSEELLWLRAAKRSIYTPI
jgi:hypothetical protein